MFKLKYPQSTTRLSTQHLLLVCQQVWNAMQVGDVPQSQWKGEPPMPKPCNCDEATAKYIPERSKHIYIYIYIYTNMGYKVMGLKTKHVHANLEARKLHAMTW